MIGKLKNGYFIDSTSGLAFKLNLLVMGSLGNSLGKINEEVNRINSLIKNEAQRCLVTLGLFLSVWDKAIGTSPNMVDELGSKTLPFVYLSKEIAHPEDIPLPRGFFEKAFVWNGSDDKVWTPFNTNNLGYRYKAIQESQIPHLDTPPAVSVIKQGYIVCPHCQGKLVL